MRRFRRRVSAVSPEEGVQRRSWIREEQPARENRGRASARALRRRVQSLYAPCDRERGSGGPTGVTATYLNAREGLT
jgi:hypothetical protein